MYKITFNFCSPLSFSELPIFDSILSYCHVKEKLGTVPQKLSLTEEELKILDDLPLKKHENGYYYASYLQFENKIESVQFWCKRWHNTDDNLADFKKNKRQIDVQRGEFKSYQMPLVVNDIRQGSFIFDTEDKERVQYLILKHCAGIGKKISQGFGFYKEFFIEDTSEKIYRPIPFSRLTSEQKKDGGNIAYRSWRPPYWLSSNMEACIDCYI